MGQVGKRNIGRSFPQKKSMRARLYHREEQPFLKSGEVEGAPSRRDLDLTEMGGGIS